MMPDELTPIYDVETALKALQNERGMRFALEMKVAELSAENLSLRGQLCQCRIDREITDLVEP